MNLGWFIFALLLLPLVLVLGIPVAMAHYCLNTRYEEEFGENACFDSWTECLFGSFLVFIGFIIGLIANAVALPFIIAIGIPVCIVTMVLRRRQIHRNAERRLKEIMELNKPLYFEQEV